MTTRYDDAYEYGIGAHALGGGDPAQNLSAAMVFAGFVVGHDKARWQFGWSPLTLDVLWSDFQELMKQ